MADCRRNGRGACRTDAANGCVHWMRETDVDDDDWSPTPLMRLKSPERKPFEMTPELRATVQRIQADLDSRAADLAAGYPAM